MIFVLFHGVGVIFGMWRRGHENPTYISEERGEVLRFPGATLLV